MTTLERKFYPIVYILLIFSFGTIITGLVFQNILFSSIGLFVLGIGFGLMMMKMNTRINKIINEYDTQKKESIE
ncbi:MAG: hypothetical protein KJI69_04170 [Patescibacteria group bacterium]|nr:hypothetical protein [Patescibacteria group bacterium]